MTASRPNARGSNSTHLRIYNERTILQHLRRAQKASKADLARSAHLTNAAVGAIIHSLEEAHLIEEIGKFHAGGRGQPATLLRPNPKGAFAIGLCLGITSYQVVLIDFSCRPVTKSRSFPYQEDSGASVIDRINASVEDLIRPLSKKEKQRLTGIGLTVPCPQLLLGDAATDDLAASGFPKVADLTARLKDSFSLPVIQETRGLAATTAELFFGLGSQNSDFIYIHVGESIGGALCIDGDIFRGHAGNAGDISLLPTFPQPNRRNPALTEGIIPLQSRASLRSLRQKLEKKLEEEPNTRSLQELMEDAPESTNDWLNDCELALSFTIGTICNLLDIPVCIIDCELGTEFAQRIVERLITTNDQPGHVPVNAEMLVGSFGEESCLKGAATLPMFEKFSPRQAILTNA